MFYKIHQWYHRQWFMYGTRGIFSTPPRTCQSTAMVEIHTMLSHEDMPLYLIAIKSLLRFTADAAVVVHSDGSLRKSDENILYHHIPGIRIVTQEKAEQRARERLADEPRLRKIRTIDASYRRLVDTELWCGAKYRIIMDADIIVLNRPEAITNWIKQPNRPFFIGDYKLEATQNALSGVDVQSRFRSRLSVTANALGMPELFPQGGCSAFYGCSNELNLGTIERVFEAASRADVPMSRWGGEQCLVIYTLASANSMRLDPSLYFNFHPGLANKIADAHVVHFIGLHRWYRHLYTYMAARVVRELHLLKGGD